MVTGQFLNRINIGTIALPFDPQNRFKAMSNLIMMCYLHFDSTEQ